MVIEVAGQGLGNDAHQAAGCIRSRDVVTEYASVAGGNRDQRRHQRE